PKRSAFASRLLRAHSYFRTCRSVSQVYLGTFSARLLRYGEWDDTQNERVVNQLGTALTARGATMAYSLSPPALTEALVRANQHWQLRHQEEAERSEKAAAPAFTIALSREAGTYGAAIARAVADRLGWPVYDSELLQRIST